MKITTRGVFVLTGLFYCNILFGYADHPKRQNDNLETALHGNRQLLKGEKTTGASVITAAISGNSRRLLTTTEFTFRAPKITGLKNGVKWRRKKEPDMASAAMSVSFALKSATSLRERADVASSKHGKRRRHRRCKSRFGCAVRPGAKRKIKNNNDVEDQSRNQRLQYYQTIHIGNRSLAMFRQDLALAAAVAAAEVSSKKRKTKLAENESETISREIAEMFADTKTGSHPEPISKLMFLPKILMKNKRNRINETSGSRNVKKYGERGRKKKFVKIKDWGIDGLTTYDPVDDNDSSIYAPYYLPVKQRRIIIPQSLIPLISKLVDTLKNTSAVTEGHKLLRDLHKRKNSSNDDDLCQKWLNSGEKLQQAFIGPRVHLPACPCKYPSSIFYDDRIWDKRYQKYFRWRDVSGKSERLDVYKSGATYCVRSMLAQGNSSAAAQHCCYDEQRRLITRGSGAGTPNFVSPEISPELHARIDILPWQLCKGDFSRFNNVQRPNNDNNCETNPDDEEYRDQIENTKHY